MIKYEYTFESFKQAFNNARMTQVSTRYPLPEFSKIVDFLKTQGYVFKDQATSRNGDTYFHFVNVSVGKNSRNYSFDEFKSHFQGNRTTQVSNRYPPGEFKKIVNFLESQNYELTSRTPTKDGRTVYYHFTKIVKVRSINVEDYLKAAENKLDTTNMDECEPRILEEKKSSNLLTYHDFIIYSYNFNCAKNHQTETVTALLPLVKKDGTIIQEKVDAAYCQTCDKYYILKTDYDRLKKWGTILCKQISEEKFISNEFLDTYDQLSPMSELRLLGYTVDSKENLTDNQRQKILLYAISSHVYSYERMKSFITWLVDRGSSKSHMDNAIRKWKADLQFLINYNTNELRNVGVKTVKETKYKKFSDD